MGQVTITLNGRTYRLRCGEGEEARLIELADVVRDKLQTLIDQFGQAGDDRLLLMSALLIADELVDARARLAALSGETQPPPPEQASPARAQPGRTPRAERSRLPTAAPGSEPPPIPQPTAPFPGQ